ncbi:MAG: BREX-1 system adenine-specific DNA-methyltransferase PglX [Endozoicomonadaceae bacterium]|nr:BREX-1 system adenine-specific DNA-methyltransferase PglX [Endozoicomonadaceae bacterium]
MNTNILKKYAPQARRAFISAVMKRINELGIYSDNQISDAYIDGDVYIIDGRTFEASVKVKRQILVRKVKEIGFNNLIEQVAFTWFNRLCAIRYMELHDYLDHGFRVLSHPEQKGHFQILDYAADAAEDLELKKEEILELKLASGKEEQLYRQLLLAQCHQLHIAMPFLFEAIGDETELLLPDNLLRTDSVIIGLVDAIPEEEWKHVEIIGWLYQFYISEKKDEVIGKVVKSEDIPAATQLFTPNWIVQYLVQNSVGHQWLQTYPESSIKMDMPYYIEPAEQSDEVNAQLAELTPDAIEPESIKVLDPACGSGHILVEAYNILKAIYLDMKYRLREIPRLILENNLYGLDIDDRAAQLAGFALMMMARKDDRLIFTREVKLNVLSVKETSHLDLPKLWQGLDLNNQQGLGHSEDLFAVESDDSDDPSYKLLKHCKAWFVQANTLGSLIEVPESEQSSLQQLYIKLCDLAKVGNSPQKTASLQLLPYVHQAWILAQRYDSVIANPPYMGSKGMNEDLKSFAKLHYPNSKSDLFAMFMERAFSLLNEQGFNAQVNMQSWMFLSSFEKLRTSLLTNQTIKTMAHLGSRAFSQISGDVVQTTAWVMCKSHIKEYQPTFFRLTGGGEKDKELNLLAKRHKFFRIKPKEFQNIPLSPIGYWLDKKLVDTFSNNRSLGDISHSFQGLITGNNDYYLRSWTEISLSEICWSYEDSLDSKSSNWIPYNKGGPSRKWFGNNEFLIRWDGQGDSLTRSRGENRSYYYREGITWSDIAASNGSFRYSTAGGLFDASGPTAFLTNNNVRIMSLLGFLNTSYVAKVSKILNPTIHFQSENYKSLPFLSGLFSNEIFYQNSKKCVSQAKDDWDSFEISWGFRSSALIGHSQTSLKESFVIFNEINKKRANYIKLSEEGNNRIVASEYFLEEAIEVDVLIENVTLYSNPYYRYDGISCEKSKIEMYKSDTLSEFVSYSIGCMMGRYSLSKDGLIYAHASNEGFSELVNEGAYKKFPADDDGIIPLTDLEWFNDDATYRFRDFVRTIWGEEHLQENLDFVAESLCLHAIKPKRAESSLEAIRRYLSTQFFKDHLKTYKKRPIYWLFSSGKQKAFDCLVYLHRYNEGTLSRMRTEYVTPLIGKYSARLSQLEQQLDSALTSEQSKLKKEISLLESKQSELRTFDDNLKHRADMRIDIDLDDGVKVNYGKFGNLLAEVKAIHGKAIKS